MEKSDPGQHLDKVSKFSLCLCGFPSTSPVSSHTHKKTSSAKLLNWLKFALVCAPHYLYRETNFAALHTIPQCNFCISETHTQPCVQNSCRIATSLMSYQLRCRSSSLSMYGLFLGTAIFNGKQQTGTDQTCANSNCGIPSVLQDSQISIKK